MVGCSTCRIATCIQIDLRNCDLYLLTVQLQVAECHFPITLQEGSSSDEEDSEEEDKGGLGKRSKTTPTVAPPTKRMKNGSDAEEEGEKESCVG